MRPLSPFLISFALALLVAVAPHRAEAQPASVSSAEVRAQVLDKLAQQVATYFQAEGTLTLEPQRTWVAPVLAPGWDLAIVEYPKELSSALILRFRIVSNGEVVTEPTVVFRAQLMRDVYFSRTPVEREALFEPAVLETRNVDVLRERDPVLVSAPIKDMIFNRAVSAGRVILWSDLARRPMVRRGEMIEVAATDGSMTIVLRAQALDNGSAGEVVRVRNMESRKDFNAFVVAEKRAEVRF